MTTLASTGKVMVTGVTGFLGSHTVIQLLNRFYNRQFITRSPVAEDLLTRFTADLKRYYQQAEAGPEGLHRFPALLIAYRCPPTTSVISSKAVRGKAPSNTSTWPSSTRLRSCCSARAIR